MRSHVQDAREREQRQRSYLAAPVMAQAFPGVSELAVKFRFTDPEGKEKPQPYSQLFVPDMRAFFQFQCPLRDCTGGGFDLSTAVPKGLSHKNGNGNGNGGPLACGGQRKRPHGDTSRCGLQLEYEVISPGPRAAKA